MKMTRNASQTARIQSLRDRLDMLVRLAARVGAVQEWLDLDTARFDSHFSQLQEVWRTFDGLVCSWAESNESKYQVLRLTVLALSASVHLSLPP